MIWMLVTMLQALRMFGTLTPHAPSGGPHMLRALAGRPLAPS